jgi:hypothetical protein
MVPPAAFRDPSRHLRTQPGGWVHRSLKGRQRPPPQSRLPCDPSHQQLQYHNRWCNRLQQANRHERHLCRCGPESATDPLAQLPHVLHVRDEWALVSDAYGSTRAGFGLATAFAFLLCAGLVVNWLIDPAKQRVQNVDRQDYDASLPAVRAE